MRFFSHKKYRSDVCCFVHNQPKKKQVGLLQQLCPKKLQESTLTDWFKKFPWLLGFQNQGNHLRRLIVQVNLLDDFFKGFTLILVAFFTVHSLKPGEETNSFIAFSVLSLVNFSNSSFVSFLLPSGVLWNEEGNISESDSGTVLDIFLEPA